MSTVATFICCLLPFVTAMGWGLFLVASKGRIRRTRRLLGFAMILFALACLGVAFKQLPMTMSHVPFIVLTAVSGLFCCPTYIFFLVRLTKMRGPSWIEWMLYIPAAGFTLGVLVLSMLGILGEGATPRSIQTLKLVYRIVLLSEMLFSVVVGEMYLHEYNLQLEEYYANKDNDSLLRSQLVTIFSALILPFTALRMVPLNNTVVAVCSLVLAVLALLIGYYGSMVRYTAEILSDRIAEADRAESENVDVAETRLAAIRDHLEKVAKTDKFFIDPQVSVTKLALWLGTNRTFLRQTLQVYYDCSFADYINNLRIHYAMRLIDEGFMNHVTDGPTSLSQREQLQQLAMQCGFESYTSFVRNFTRVAHYSPEEYLKKDDD